MQKDIERTLTSRNTWVFIWETTAQGVGHVGIQIGGESPGDSTGVYKSAHPQVPVFGPFVVYPMPLVSPSSWIEDAEAESQSLHDTTIKNPDVVFHTTTLDTTKMQTCATREIQEAKYQLAPGIHPWSFFKRAAEDITYQPTERPEYPHMLFAPEEKTHNCATFVAEVLKTGGAPLTSSRFPWVMSPNSVSSQLSSHPDFKPVSIEAPKI